ncbi:hypothetical protein LCGC14_1738460 [marine sediment metagenome]|uniref:Uncharacterized protein n=1 Tax=marine sediment metagenome TaxID=412755 RepID=A0A0F9K725_9ZZZZ
MGVLQHDGTVVNLDALTAIFDTNANGFGPETTKNPDMAGPVPAGAPMPWQGGYRSAGIRGTSTGNQTVSLGRSSKLPVGNATLPGVTTG